jgi:hypothetical protein
VRRRTALRSSGALLDGARSLHAIRKELTMRMSKVILCVVLSVTAYACDGDNDADDAYDYYYDVPVSYAYWDDWSTSTMYGFSDPYVDPYYGTFLTVSRETPDDPEEAAEIVAINIDEYFPDGCATVDRAGSELSVTLAACSMPFSDQTLDGSFRVSFGRVNDDSIEFEVAATGLMVDGQHASLTANAVYTAEGDQKTVQYTSESSFTRDSRRLEGTFDSTLTWNAGSQCVTRNATGDITTDDEQRFAVQVEDYTRCAGECPASGVVTMSGPEDMASLTFSGESTARLVRRSGQVQTVQLECE